MREDISTLRAEISRLKEENGRLREALEPFAKAAQYCAGFEPHEFTDVRIGDIRKARTALSEAGS